MYYSVHPPSDYILQHQARLLPTWSHSIASVLVMLQPSPVALLERTLDSEPEKEKLRSRFLELGRAIAQTLQRQGYLADLFDPRTGWPILSARGTLPLDDVAVARSALGYSTDRYGNCRVILHPRLGTAVYPSTLVSSAPIDVLGAIAQQVLEVAAPQPWHKGD
ncbi:MAG: methylmalonic aciduria and homocystinuria type D protein [Cyanobacteriota bacterium]